MWLLQKAGRLGKGSSVSWLLFLIILIMTIINRKITDRLQGPEDERPNDS
jgi:ABC-type sugar transport system permease subunit